MKTIFFLLVVLLCLPGILQPCHAGVEWSLKKQMPVDSEPLDIAIAPDGKWMFVLTPGQVIIYEAKSDRVLNRIPLDKAYDSMTYSSSDNTLFLSSRSDKAIKLIGIDAVHPFSTSGLPFKGPENAPVTIAVFSDYQCPYCGRIEPQLGQVLEKYPKDIKLIFKHFPLPMHPYAYKASVASLAAHRQGKFWEMHHTLFEAGSSLNDAKIEEIAKGLGLDMEKFRKDLNDPELQNLVNRDISEGIAAEVAGTPSLFVNGKSVTNRSLEGFQQMIEAELKKKR